MHKIFIFHFFFSEKNCISLFQGKKKKNLGLGKNSSLIHLDKKKRRIERSRLFFQIIIALLDPSGRHVQWQINSWKFNFCSYLTEQTICFMHLGLEFNCLLEEMQWKPHAFSINCKERKSHKLLLRLSPAFIVTWSFHADCSFGSW